MASQRCINLLKKGAAHLSTKEARELVEELEKRASTKARKENIDFDEALKRTGQELLDEEAKAVRLKKKQAVQNMRVNRQIDNFISKFDNPFEGWRAYLGGIESNIESSRKSVDAVQKAEAGKLRGKFVAKLEELDLTHTWFDPNNEQILARELFEPGSTGHKKAAQVAEAINEVYADIRRLSNLHGAEIGEIESYVARQTHNQERLAHADESVFKRQQLRRDIINKHKAENPGNRQKAYQAATKELKDIAYGRWKNFILPLLDTSKTKGLDIDNPDEYLRKVYDAIVSGVHLKDTAEEFTGKFEIRKTGNLSDRLSASRQLFFKDGLAWSQYNSKYGYGNIQTAVSQTIEGAGKNIGLLKQMGTNPREMFNAKQRELQALAVEKGLSNNKIGFESKRARWIFSEIDRERTEPVASMTQKIGSSIRQYVASTKLGFVMISAFSDLASRGAAMRQNGRGFLTGIKEGVFDTFNFQTDTERKQIAALIGAWSKVSTGYSRARFAAEDANAGFFTRQMQLFMKVNGMEFWDRNQRIGVGTVLSKNLAMNRANSFAQLDERLANTLSLYGIEEAEWDLIRESENLIKPHGNEIYVTPDGPKTFTDDSIRRYLGKPDATQNEIELAKDDIETRLRTYFVDQTDFANLQPGAADRAILHMGTSPDDILGQVLRSVVQFKYFSVGFARRILGRHIFGQGAQSMTDFSKMDISGLVQMALATTALGYVSVASKDILKGRTPRPPEDARTMAQSLVQGMGLGIFGDFLWGQYDRFGHSFTGSMLGPSFGTLDDVAGLVSAIVQGNEPSHMALRVAKSDVPFVNLWYTSLAWQGLFLNDMSEAISPGSLKRYQRRVEKENNQQFLISPSSFRLSQLGR